ncbi:uncharacterized protein LOC115955481 [Quercus lobata]|uniref:uncharacterized protein LOC115955481 n=1 Tax=Quercus lobata TaxID=97700 RepID=UPI00124901CB|nr:uncharacterized protein LOC115955481 [Quercus lobata]
MVHSQHFVIMYENCGMYIMKIMEPILQLMEQTFNAVQITFNSLWLKSILLSGENCASHQALLLLYSSGELQEVFGVELSARVWQLINVTRVVGLHSQGHIDRLGMHACKYAIPLGKGVI